MLFSEPLPMSDRAPKLEGGTLHVTIAIGRPDKSSSEGQVGAIGVSAVIRGDDDVVCIRQSGYAASEDMGLAAVIAYVLVYVRQDHQRLIVHCRGLETLKWIPGARLRGGMRSGKNKNKPVKAFSLLDYVEATEGQYWFHQSFEKDEEPSDYEAARREAVTALEVAKELVSEFEHHRDHNPDWCFLEGAINEFPEAVTVGAL